MFDELPAPVINPEIACMYQWHFHEGSDEARISIPLPSTDFDTTQVQVSLSEDGNAILIEIPNEVPIVEGTLFGSVKSFSQEATKSELVVKLVKSEPGTWDLAIVGPDPSTNSLDPKSAFDLFGAVGNSSSTPSSMHWIEYAMSVGYPPALLLGFRASLRGDEEAQKRGMGFLTVAADTYEDPVALLTLGNHLAMQEETRDEAFDMYGRAAKAGAPLGLSLMGQLLSPLSDIPFHHKDAWKARSLFETALEHGEDAVAMSELAKLLYNGDGGREDRVKAEILDAKARELSPDLPPLRKVASSKHSPFLSVYQGVTVASFACAGLYVCYRIWKGRRHA